MVFANAFVVVQKGFGIPFRSRFDNQRYELAEVSIESPELIVGVFDIDSSGRDFQILLERNLNDRGKVDWLIGDGLSSGECRRNSG